MDAILTEPQIREVLDRHEVDFVQVRSVFFRASVSAENTARALLALEARIAEVEGERDGYLRALNLAAESIVKIANAFGREVSSPDDVPLVIAAVTEAAARLASIEKAAGEALWVMGNAVAILYCEREDEGQPLCTSAGTGSTEWCENCVVRTTVSAAKESISTALALPGAEGREGEGSHD